MVYGPSIYHEKCQFWNSLADLAETLTESWLFVGDFNSVSSQHEKRGGKPFASSSKFGLLHFSNAAGLIDLGFNGNPFTWNNGYLGGGNIRERLDRGLANQDYVYCACFRLCFDHLPLVLNTEGHGNLSQRLFRFEEMWPRDQGSFYIVASAWAMQVEGSPGQKLIKKMDLTKSALRKWNKLHFGFIKDWIHSPIGR